MGRFDKSSKNAAKVTKPRQRRSTRLAAKRASANQKLATPLADSEPDSVATQSSMSMRLAAALPPRMGVNKDIPIPVVVLFDQENEHASDADDVWAFASLIEEAASSDSHEDLLSGQRVDSVHTLSPQDAYLQNTFGYASFPHLQISRPGRFRLRITAIDMKSSESAGRVLPTLTSEVFDVIESFEAEASDIPTNGALAQLKQLGIIDG